MGLDLPGEVPSLRLIAGHLLDAPVAGHRRRGHVGADSGVCRRGRVPPQHLIAEQLVNANVAGGPERGDLGADTPVRPRASQARREPPRAYSQ